MFLPLIFLSFLSACNDGMSDENIKIFINTTFNDANSTKGHYGWELVGKGQWFEGRDFEKSCLESNNLAFRNHDKARKGFLSPTYKAQRYLVHSTNRGYCLELGRDLSIDIGEIKTETAYSMRKVSVSFMIQDPSPWFGCLKQDVVNQDILLEKGSDGKPNLDSRYDLALQSNNNCPRPIVKSEERSSTSRPTSAPASAPSLAQAKKLAKSFDSALSKGEWKKAKEMLSCVDLYEANSWGKCALSEILSLASISGEDPRGGTPWLEYRLNNIDKADKLIPDKTDPTLFHVVFNDRKSKQRRSFSVQNVQGKWKILGAITILDSGLTPLRFINDLHSKKHRDIFERRLNGEKIDYRGISLDPYAEQKE